MYIYIQHVYACVYVYIYILLTSSIKKWKKKLHRKNKIFSFSLPCSACLLRPPSCHDPSPLLLFSLLVPLFPPVWKGKWIRPHLVYKCKCGHIQRSLITSASAGIWASVCPLYVCSVWCWISMFGSFECVFNYLPSTGYWERARAGERGKRRLIQAV